MRSIKLNLCFTQADTEMSVIKTNDIVYKSNMTSLNGI